MAQKSFDACNLQKIIVTTQFILHNVWIDFIAYKNKRRFYVILFFF